MIKFGLACKECSWGGWLLKARVKGGSLVITECLGHECHVFLSIQDKCNKKAGFRILRCCREGDPLIFHR